MNKKYTRLYIISLGILVSVFCYHNYAIYSDKGVAGNMPLSENAIHGQQLWQQNNCFTCHQLYGLGGYLGPDLTNIYSQPGKGPAYIKLMLNSGIKTMPRFNFSEVEKAALTAYLQEIDRSGDYPNRRAVFHYNGWVEIPYKHGK